MLSLRDPADADLIDGSIGEESPFHRTFGYHAHGIQLEAMILSEGWRDRLVRVSTPAIVGVVGLCLEVHDLAVSKLLAGLVKDIRFVAALVQHRYGNVAVIRRRMDATPAHSALIDRASHLLANIEAGRI